MRIFWWVWLTILSVFDGVVLVISIQRGDTIMASLATLALVFGAIAMGLVGCE